MTRMAEHESSNSPSASALNGVQTPSALDGVQLKCTLCLAKVNCLPAVRPPSQAGLHLALKSHLTTLESTLLTISFRFVLGFITSPS